jgi:hypothetical protein
VTPNLRGSGFMLAEMDLVPQQPFIAMRRNYTRVGAYNQQFLGATNLLLTRPFKIAGARGKWLPSCSAA